MKIRTLWQRPSGRAGAALLAVAALIGGAAATAPGWRASHSMTNIREVDAAAADNSTVSNAGAPVTVYAYSGNGTTLDTTLPTVGNILGGSQASVLCYFTATTPVTDPNGQSSDPYWDEISTTGIGTLGPLAAGDVAVIPDAFMNTATPVNQMVPACPANGVVAPPAPPTSTPTATPTSTPPSSAPGTQPGGGVVIDPIPSSGTDDQGPGEACVFARTSGAMGFGHIGWGWEVGSTGDYVFGSTENPGGAPFVRPGDPNANGAWHDEQIGKAQMLAVFANPASDPAVPNGVPPYNLYRCEPTTVSHVAAARTAIIQAENAGYCVTSTGHIMGTNGNCLDAAIMILTAYGATGLPSPTGGNMFPNNWFNSLAPPWDTPPLQLP